MSTYEVCYIHSFTKEQVIEEVDAVEYKVETGPRVVSFMTWDGNREYRNVRTYFGVQYVKKIST